MDLEKSIASIFRAGNYFKKLAAFIFRKKE
jgi:hypothetical protein